MSQNRNDISKEILNNILFLPIKLFNYRVYYVDEKLNIKLKDKNIIRRLLKLKFDLNCVYIVTHSNKLTNKIVKYLKNYSVNVKPLYTVY